MVQKDAQKDIDRAAEEAHERMEAIVLKAEKDIQDSCAAVLSGLDKTARTFDANGLEQKIKSTSKVAQNNVSYRIEVLEHEYHKLEKQTDNLLDRMIARETSISPAEIQRALGEIGTHTANLLKLNEAVTKMENDHVYHCNDNLKRFEAVSDRLDEMRLKSEAYYTVTTPQKIQEAATLLSQLKNDIAEMRKRYDEFIQDRIARLEATNRQIEEVRQTAREVEVKVMEKIDRNQIRTQQYVIGIVVGLIATIVTSMILVQLHI